MKFDWNDIPLLLKLAESGNMAQTARDLDLVTSTVSRRVAAAEQALGIRLFIRDHAGYQPTAGGKVLLSHADTIVDRVQTMLLESKEEAQDVSGAVNITAIDVLLSHWLVRHVPGLLAEHPRLELNLIGDFRELSFTRREADLAIRLNRPTADAALRMRKIGKLGFAVYGAENFSGAARKEWPHLPWLSFPDEMSKLAEMQWLAKIGPAQKIRLTSISMIARACEAGVGIALLPCVAGDRLNLIRLQEEPESQRELWLLSHKDAGQVARFRAVSEWLGEKAEQDAALLAGT
ncbi:DNA-binding transcriptional LysR family regulator [Lysobacter niastensis]|uniref:DNA-binding transcriptional LysR family regulator n=1 Tax=Lysobacter niastensis TaxID=380629 RepID=A0ABU1W9U4_9GAMM|nr:LysR family transcriptional regulator [Lysobacter niastensis]MDR7134375.1 DNA-binding transcriptional LysR family regulator [Lysobacter niastensis]